MMNYMSLPNNCGRSSNGQSTAVSHFRSKRKRFISPNVTFVCVAIVFVCMLSNIGHQVDARPSQEEDLSEEFKEVDNVEIHRVEMVDGEMHMDHPIIIYKEDFVNEDYVPSTTEKPKRRYKDISHRRHRHHNNHQRHNQTAASGGDEIETDKKIHKTTEEEYQQLKPEKILFDVIPETPIVVLDDDYDEKSLTKHKARKSRIKLIPLEEETENSESDAVSNSKDELLKRPKKYNGKRSKRDLLSLLGQDHVLHKRNPYIRQGTPLSQFADVQLPKHYIYVKHSVPGKKHNALDIPVTRRPQTPPATQGPDNVPISFDNRIAADENDRVIFSGGSNRAQPTRTTSRPQSLATRPPESIFRDPNPENYDFSFMSTRRPATSNNRPPPATRAPESIFRDPNPESYDFSFMNPTQQSQSGSATSNRGVSRSPVTQQPQSPSECVWAILQCCSQRNSQVRYSCFEQNGCYSAFWGLNPCAENVRDNIVSYVSDFYD